MRFPWLARTKRCTKPFVPPGDRDNELKVEFVPPGNHRTNPAERAVQTVKKHIVSSLATCHVSFPPDLWHLLVPTMELTLNCQQKWTPDPTRSAYDPMDFSAHPLHPVGQLCVPYPCPQAPVLAPPWPQSPLHWSCYRPLPVRQVIYSPDPNPYNFSHGSPLDYPDPLFHWAKPETPPPYLSPTPYDPTLLQQMDPTC
jgi:hypothetical protein